MVSKTGSAAGPTDHLTSQHKTPNGNLDLKCELGSLGGKEIGKAENWHRQGPRGPLLQTPKAPMCPGGKAQVPQQWPPKPHTKAWFHPHSTRAGHGQRKWQMFHQCNKYHSFKVPPVPQTHSLVPVPTVLPSAIFLAPLRGGRTGGRKCSSGQLGREEAAPGLCTKGH